MPKYYPLFINGQPVETGNHETIANPYNGEAVGTITVAGKDELESAIRGAVQAFESNRGLSVYRRRAVLDGIVERLRSRRQELIELIVRESGKPITLSGIEVDRATTTFRLAAEECARFGGEVMPVDFQANTEGYTCRVQRFPSGPISAITPFNFPLNLTAHKLAPALAVGSSVVLKPPAQCPLSNLVLADIVHDAGAAPGTFNVVHMHPPARRMPRHRRTFQASQCYGFGPAGLASQTDCREEESHPGAGRERGRDRAR